MSALSRLTTALSPARRDIARVTTLPATLADEVRALDSVPPAPKCANAGCLRSVASRGFCALCAVRMGVYNGR